MKSITVTISGKNSDRGGDNMNFSKKTGKKKGAAAAVLCFVAAIAIAGTYTFNDYKKSLNEKELAKAEEMDFTEENYAADVEDTPQEEAVDGTIVSNESSDMENLVSEDAMTAAADTETVEEVLTDVSSNHAASVNFSDSSKILWPVAGTILMDYSMDKTVYFKTLDQYKYNPAMIIAGAQGDQVIAGAAGIVKSIDQTAETGLTVNVDFGNGYEAIYGQLVSTQVKTGDYVEATTTLGYVAEPTKYYVNEGSNLYFEMRKNGRPVDPKEYLTDYVE